MAPTVVAPPLGDDDSSALRAQKSAFQLLRGPRFRVAGAREILRCPSGVLQCDNASIEAADRDIRRAPRGILRSGNSEVLRSTLGVYRCPAGEILRLSAGNVQWDFNVAQDIEIPITRPPLPRASSRKALAEIRRRKSEAAESEDAGGIEAVKKVGETQPLDIEAVKKGAEVRHPEPSPAKPALEDLSEADSVVSEERPPPPELDGSRGQAADWPAQCKRRGAPFSWIRYDNTEPARAARRRIRDLTRAAVKSSEYKLRGLSVHLKGVQAMLDGTVIAAPGLGNLPMPSGDGTFVATTVSQHDGVVLEAAQDANKRHRGRVGVVSASSAYHCGGGFLSGGRHALEEAICVQTPLYESIAKAYDDAHRNAGKAGDRDDFMYIPVDGVVISPKCELFREGSGSGYSFMESPVELAAVISVAMFNRNSSMRDAPMDAPASDEEYEVAVRAKFRSVFAAAVQAGCSALVVPDVGCGVYQNDPKTVGRLLGEVLRQEFWCHLKEVVVTGKFEFKDAVVSATQERRGSTTSARVSGSSKADIAKLIDKFDATHGKKASISSSSGGRRSPSPPPVLSAPARRSPSPPPVLPAPARPSPSPAPMLPTQSRSPSPAGGLCAKGCGRSTAPGFKTCCRQCGRTNGYGGHDEGCGEKAPPKPSVSVAATRRLCKLGCGREVKKGLRPSGDPWDTCCRACAVSRGSMGKHDATCGT